jgi:hypothetical protein
MSDIPVYDVSGTKYIPGATNFTSENIFAALRSAGITERRNLFATIPVAVHDALQINNMLEHVGERRYYAQFQVFIDHAAGCGIVCDSLLTDGKTSVILRTREY